MGSRLWWSATVTAGMVLVLLVPVAARATGAVVPSPNVGKGPNSLSGVEVLAGEDAWAVGYRAPTDRPYRHAPLAEHWDGTAWRVINTPNPAGVSVQLEGVSGTGSQDVWAVGGISDPGSLDSSTLIEHWNGTQWQVVPSPNPGGPEWPDRLHAVTAVGSWAVGTYWEPNGISYKHRSLIERWNGNAWRAVANPGTAELFGVSAVSRDDIWAVGPNQTLHWNGRSWTVVPPAIPAGNSIVLRGVAAVSSHLAWAVGFTQFSCSDGLCARPLIERWNGSAWVIVPVNVEGLGGLTAITASSGDAWTVGNGGANGGLLVERLENGGWLPVSTPRVKEGELLSVDQGGGQVWTVGDRYSYGTHSDRTLTLRLS
jgi:hypothetical protein